MANDSSTLYNSLNESTLFLLRDLCNVSKMIHIRGSLVKRLNRVFISLKDPTKRLITLKFRGNNLPATFAEILWIHSGTNELRFLHPFLPRVTEYSDDYQFMIENGASHEDAVKNSSWIASYGQRIFSYYTQDPSHYINQFKIVIDTLTDDPTSRRAFISIPDPEFDDNRKPDRKDVPCTMNLVIDTDLDENDGKFSLNITTFMRSNDIIFGFSNINIPEFTFLQELLVNELNRISGVDKFKLGRYYHLSNDLQLYERHFERAEKILNHYSHFVNSFNLQEELAEDNYVNVPVKFQPSNWESLINSYKKPMGIYYTEFNVVLYKFFSMLVEENNVNWCLEWFNKYFEPKSDCFDYLSFYMHYVSSYYFGNEEIIKQYLEKYESYFTEYRSSIDNIYIPQLNKAISKFNNKQTIIKQEVISNE